MARPRATEQSLELSGLSEKRPGYYGQRNHKTGQVIPRDSHITCPKEIKSKEAKKAWKIVTDNLIGMGALSEQDQPMLGALFEAYDRYLTLKKRLNDFDCNPEADWYSDKWIKGRYTLHRMMTVELDEFIKLAARFGLTPTERSRLLCAPDEEKEVDPLEVVLEGN